MLTITNIGRPNKPDKTPRGFINKVLLFLAFGYYFKFETDSPITLGNGICETSQKVFSQKLIHRISVIINESFNKCLWKIQLTRIKIHTIDLLQHKRTEKSIYTYHNIYVCVLGGVVGSLGVEKC